MEERQYTAKKRANALLQSHKTTMTLEGKTPAEVAGLPKETWKSLLEKSLKKTNS